MPKMLYIPPTIKQTTSGYLDKHGYGGDESWDQIEGIAISDLVARFGSPLFVFSERRLKSNYLDAQHAFSTRYPKVQFAWSYKTNYLRAICSIFHREGAIAEVVSDFEYEKARSLGMRGDQIFLNGPYKSEALLQRAVAEQAMIQIDNYNELTLVERIANQSGRPVPVALRVNVETGIEPAWTKFGFSYESGEALLAAQRVIDCPSLDLVGLHMHIGTFILDPKQYRIALEKLLELAQELREQHQITLKYVNVGGGFASNSTLRHQYLPGKEATPSFAQYADAICDVLYNHLPDDSPLPTLFLETGRALVDDAGYLIASVIDSRRTAEGLRSIVIDAGINILYTAAWYRFDIRPAQQCVGPIAATTVYGPLCMNVDVVRDAVPLPPINPGDQLVIHPVGAYNITQSMQFITYRPAVVLIGEQGEVDLIRQREDLAYVEEPERLPDRLRLRDRP